MTGPSAEPWPALPYVEWEATLDTLHMEMQILGKVRVALSPKEPEWAHVPLYVTARGISTGTIPSARGLFEVEADLIAHEVVVRTTSGDTSTVPLASRPVADFYAEFVDALQTLEIDVELSPMPQEVPDPIPFPDDRVHHIYEPGDSHRFWRALTLVQPVFAEYRAAFRGKVSLVQFFWGSMDLNVTRFSGGRCSPPPGAERLIRETYDAEQFSAGFWPGHAAFPEPAFFAYAYPKPDGIEAIALTGPGSWNDELGEFVLRYDDVRTAPAPAAVIRQFLDESYDVAARLGGWDAALCTDPS